MVVGIPTTMDLGLFQLLSQVFIGSVAILHFKNRGLHILQRKKKKPTDATEAAEVFVLIKLNSSDELTTILKMETITQ